MMNELRHYPLIIVCYIIDIFNFARADQRDKACFIFHKMQGCCMESKAQLGSQLLLFLSDSTFQKVTIAFMHTNITLDSDI